MIGRFAFFAASLARPQVATLMKSRTVGSNLVTSSYLFRKNFFSKNKSEEKPQETKAQENTETAAKDNKTTAKQEEARKEETVAQEKKVYDLKELEKKSVPELVSLITNEDNRILINVLTRKLKANDETEQGRIKSIKDLTEEGKVLTKRLEDLQKKQSEFRTKLAEQIEELEMVQKRANKEKEDLKVFAISKFAKDLLEIVDNLERAMQAVEKQTELKETEFFKGIVMTHNIFIKTLESNGVKKISPLGEKFNPNLQEAIFEYDDPNGQPGHVGVVSQNGYTIGERVLRPARVGVIRQKS
eukprot:TRINITY_DN11474_c1_g1_i2.p1 TRINITY_DN11474_c1_g1~~TRINITY_DN11474_c1_g1_i2.p1  ORF type:complete len:301 (-),score=118.87 TRINITY_DN11474_c1_g1_i2:76-978(-)